MINFNMIPEDNDDEYKYLWRIGKSIEDGSAGLTWEEAAPYINMTLRSDESEYKTSSAYRKPVQNALKFYTHVFSQPGEDMASGDMVREIEKARIKLRTEKLEYNRWLREDARDDMIAEKISNAIKELPPLKMPKPIIASSKKHASKSGCLIFTDTHFGTEFCINGLFGEVINEYSPEIFEARMNNLLEQVVAICEKEGFTELNVYDLGDELEGLIRVSQIWKLRYGIIESAVLYGRYISEWLNELTTHVRVKYQMVKDSNHCQLRLWGEPKNTFKNENMSYVISEKIIDRLRDNPNFEYIQNPTGYVFDNIEGFNILGIHGEVKNPTQAIKDFSKTYRTNIDILVSGHMHHGGNEQVGIASDVVMVPSVIGVDDYSISLNKTSNPGATMIVIEQSKGKVIEYNIKL